jgi:hypothetical protein
MISKPSVKTANKIYNSLNQKFELVFAIDSIL